VQAISCSPSPYPGSPELEHLTLPLHRAAVCLPTLGPVVMCPLRTVFPRGLSSTPCSLDKDMIFRDRRRSSEFIPPLRVLAALRRLPLSLRYWLRPSYLQPCILHHPLNLPLRLWHRTRQLLCEDLTKAFERLLFPIQDRVAPLHQLHKLSRIDIGIAAAVDIVEDLRGKLDAGD
jgi:hypothetical protein